MLLGACDTCTTHGRTFRRTLRTTTRNARSNLKMSHNSDIYLL